MSSTTSFLDLASLPEAFARIRWKSRARTHTGSPIAQRPGSSRELWPPSRAKLHQAPIPRCGACSLPEERQFFARAQALGPLTYGPDVGRTGADAALRGGRVNVRV